MTYRLTKAILGPSIFLFLFVQCNKPKSSSDQKKPATSITPTPLPTNNPISPPQNVVPLPTAISTQIKIGPSKYPIILQHGFMSGKIIGKFTGAKAHLENYGFKVYESDVNPSQSSVLRGQQLAKNIDDILRITGASKVNVIAYSQGGLDTRYAISTLKYGTKIASLTMLSTPNQGTPLADVSLNNTSKTVQGHLATLLNLLSNLNGLSSGNDTYAAVSSLSESFVQKTFNPQNPDDPQVFYQSYAAQSGSNTKDSLNLSLKLSGALVSSMRGANDGVVPVTSAQWGDFKGVIDADHLDLIGYPGGTSPTASGFSHLKLLTDIAVMLRDVKGF